MKLTLLTATLALLLWGMPAMAGPPGLDSDGDGVHDGLDNCAAVANPAQDDTDGDDCGNLCDANYDQGGTVGFGDFGSFTNTGFGTTNELYNHTEPVTDTVGFGDFGFFTQNFGSPPGPSGTTAGTVACP
jgi:hypothetical protein